MSTVAFDTLKFAMRLEQAGFTWEQAKGVARAFADVFADEIVTTSHLDTLKFSQTLRDKAWAPHDQAKGLSKVFSDTTSEQLTAKTGVRETETSLRTGAFVLRSGSSLN